MTRSLLEFDTFFFRSKGKMEMEKCISFYHHAFTFYDTIPEILTAFSPPGLYRFIFSFCMASSLMTP